MAPVSLPVFQALVLLLVVDHCHGFLVSPSATYSVQRTSATTELAAAKATKKKKTSKTGGGGLGGFGKATGKWDGCESLKSWLIGKGSEIDPGISVGVADKTTGLRGVIACRDFKRGDVLFSIPRAECILDEKKADQTPLADALYPTAMERNALPSPIRVALLLLWLERKPSERAKWQEAMNAFPSQADFEADGGPMELWSSVELAEVECGQQIAEVHRRTQELLAHYEERILPKWTAATETPGSPLSGIPPPTFREFQHAVCVATSRTFGEEDKDGGYSSLLVPGVDLCNHDDPAAANTKHALAPWGNFVVLAQTAIKAGEEVYLSYGALPNRLLLAQFGFMLLGRNKPLRSDHALVRIDALLDNSIQDVKPATAESEAASDATWEAIGGPTTFINLKGNRGASGRLSRWQPAIVARSAADIVANGDQEQGKELFRGLLEHELASFSTTLQEDQARRASGESKPVRSMWALNFRIESKRMLTEELEKLDAAN